MFILIGEPDILEFDLAIKMIDFDCIFLIQYIRLDIQKIEDPL